MKIDRHEARRIAGLAHLEFDDASLDRMAAEMTKILGYIETLRDAEASMSDDGSAGPATPMRPDEARPGIDRSLAQRNAPHFENGFFVVPKVIE